MYILRHKTRKGLFHCGNADNSSDADSGIFLYDKYEIKDVLYVSLKPVR